jgi:putative methionine-R-sulfoxide reductase with GAF domain
MFTGNNDSDSDLDRYLCALERPPRRGVAELSRSKYPAAELTLSYRPDTLCASLRLGFAVTRYRSVRELLKDIERVLGPHPRLGARGRVSAGKAGGDRALPGHDSPLDAVVRLLVNGRGYLHAAVYLNGGSRLVRRAAAGAKSDCDAMDFGQGVVGKVAQSGRERVLANVSRDPDYHKILPQTRSELVMPVKIGSHVLAVIDVESARVNVFAYPARVLLRRTAVLTAKFLAGDGRYLMLEARETVADHLKPRFQAHSQPTSAKTGQTWGTQTPGAHRAAAGEKLRA